MKLFRPSQSSLVHIEAVLTSNQSPVWPAKIFQRFIDSGLQALFVTVFQTSVDFLCKKHIQKQFFTAIFRLFPVEPHCGMLPNKFYLPVSNKEGKIWLCKQCLYIFVVLFLPDSLCLDAMFGQLFTMRPLIHVLAPLFMLISLLKNEFFKYSWVIIVKEKEKEKISGWAGFQT